MIANENKTFENFFTDKSNCYACFVAQKMTKEALLKKENLPLLLLGKTGTGKTHLANAVFNRCKYEKQNLNIALVDTTEFIKEYNKSVKTNKTDNFISFYKSLDFVIFDDIHNFSGKTGLLEIFSNIIKNLLLQGKQVILTSSQKYYELKINDVVLLQLFKSSIIAEISNPKRKSKIKFVKHLFYQKNVDISKELITCISNQKIKNFIDIEAFLISLELLSNHKNKKLSINLITNLYYKLYTKPKLIQKYIGKIK